MGHKDELVAEDEFHDKQTPHSAEGPKPPPKRIPPPQSSKSAKYEFSLETLCQYRHFSSINLF